MGQSADIVYSNTLWTQVANYLRLLRVTQWIKNLFVFVPLLFSKNLFHENYFLLVLLGFLAFCLTSSAVYVMNDLFDVESDRLHPQKKSRPIASGQISERSAFVTILLLAIGIFTLSYRLDFTFILALIGYIALNVLYSVILKHLVIIDIMSIAAGFMLRVLAGAYVISVYVSSWLILTTLFISLFLAIMKRRSELGLNPLEGGSTRKVLSEYSISFTEQMATISAAGVIICYALYSVSERTISYLHSENLVYTTIFVVFGIFRFMYLVYKKSKGENATEVMMTDIPMIVNIILYVLTAIYIVYF
ncbi:MAG: decaprenyl-phosphate phosphoribosyltransferase [Ignavibacteria bacterium]|jgi:4-hydroxybenzoate polyprenyltransferase|nr:decaprenyl-phosphate phosphoribosyltransferase [Ignavibacteria bacterium]MCU7497906.1 decaprenyl-phosphate phosphoribosyltransferase [Ignavibacteria bacterium]MCU7511187.1 decaprenyl-phosphate phosphoribosyltransferase [Ignavibacteria bacterium]MCU7518733.1 decaprenyl-phosphate phosphoribosyltransferase [Ignavibacteria bacterium]MCU7522864.1 decaprenyl-phosphate phosphoribosyltransferase [Ignavibacteria bacterium]